MKRTLTMLLAAMTAVTLLTACKDEAPQVAQKPEGHPPTAAAPSGMPAAMPGQPAGVSGKVVETMNTAGYTYVLIDTGEKQVWAAGPETQVAVGDVVALAPGQEMYNYHSNSMNRDFDVILFVPSIMVGGAGQGMMGAQMPNGQMPSGHPDINAAAEVEVDFTDLTKAEGGQSVADIFANKADLSGKEVKVRGKVVRFSPQIMGKNWIHLQDGTDTDGKNDITITTDTMAEVGDTVLVTGVLTTDKDIAHGTVYDVIIEDANVVVE